MARGLTLGGYQRRAGRARADALALFVGREQSGRAAHAAGKPGEANPSAAALTAACATAATATAWRRWAGTRAGRRPSKGSDRELPCPRRLPLGPRPGRHRRGPARDGVPVPGVAGGGRRSGDESRPENGGRPEDSTPPGALVARPTR
jgi:hypothetical protein